jgi:hypothetical protein
MPDQYHQYMQDKVLTQVLDTEDFQAFKIHRPGTRMGSTMITFTPEGIVIHGDLCPGQNGVISNFGYGLGWFSKKTSPDYLCSKFLQRGWHAELAQEELEDWVRAGGDPWGDEDSDPNSERVSGLLDIICRLDRGEIGQEGLCQELVDLYGDQGILDDGSPGWGYDPSEAGWLIAIQARFVELYKAEKNEPTDFSEGGDPGSDSGRTPGYHS